MIIILFLSQQNNKNIRRIALFGFLFLIILLFSLYFFDYEVKKWKENFKFVRDLGIGFLEITSEIIQKKKDLKWMYKILMKKYV